MSLVDERGNPVSNGEAPKTRPAEVDGGQEAEENGNQVRMSEVDLKTINTGSLVDNVAIFRFQEFVIHNDIQRLEHERIKKKELAQSPQTTMLIEKIKEVQIARHNLVAELNHRFREFDMAWAERHNVKLRMDPLKEQRKAEADRGRKAPESEGEAPKEGAAEGPAKA